MPYTINPFVLIYTSITTQIKILYGTLYYYADIHVHVDVCLNVGLPECCLPVNTMPRSSMAPLSPDGFWS